MSARFAATVAVAVSIAAGLAAGGCKKTEKHDGGGAGAAAVCAGAERHGGALEWFHDAYDRALACARARHVPLVIDMWAPWCHTCLSMQAYVLTDAELAEYKGRFVYLALDTDREVNAAPVAKFPPAAWPTFFIVGSTDESIQARFVGAASVEQFSGFLGAFADDRTTDDDLAPADVRAREGDRASARKDWAAAEAAYRAALATAVPRWHRRPDVLVSTIQVISRQDHWTDCAAFAQDHLGETGSAASASDFTSYVLGCADGLAKAGDAATATTLRDAAAARLGQLTGDDDAPLSVDDRSDALMYLRDALDALGRKDEAKQAAQRQRTILDAAAAKAPDPLVASTYNWPRAEVYTYLGVGLELVPALEKSIADLPAEYDPPYRLAWVYWKAGKLDDAKRWAEQSIGLAYGPRKTRALAMLADIEKARGDAAAEKAAREAIVATWIKLPVEQRNAEAIAKANADLAALSAPPAPVPAPPAPPK